MAFEFCLGVTLGCMVVMMIRHLTGGAWGLYLRPILEAGAAPKKPEALAALCRELGFAAELSPAASGRSRELSVDDVR